MSDSNPSVSHLEATMAEARNRLSETIDELTVRAAPKNIANRQVESAKASFFSATHTPDGQVRTDRAAIAGAAVAAVVLLVVLRSRQKKKRKKQWR